MHYICTEMKRTLIIFLFSLLCAINMRAQSTDSIRISLLTCAAGDEIYSLFGHTAIRYENHTQGFDIVFNYGIFNFNTPNFVLRFALGETDYQLGVTDYKYFADEYRHQKRDVWQQTLNLTTSEKLHMINLLKENYQSENRIYRYNFFYDNCATRPRDIVEKSIEGSLLYSNDMNSVDTDATFRKLLHKYSDSHPWSRFGMDLCLGCKADEPISRRTMMFIPFYVQGFFENAQIVNNESESRPLVSSNDKVIETHSNQSNQGSFIFTPMRTFLLLFIIVATATLFGIKRKLSLWGIDLLLFFVAGAGGCILTFLSLFSQHPAVSHNYLLFVLNPFHLFLLPFIVYKVKKQQKCRYLTINFVVLTLFILLWTVIPQRIDLAVLPLSLCLLTRSVSNIILTMKT